MSFDIIDLSWVKYVNEEPDRQTYLCKICTNEDSILYEITDPEKLKFVGTARTFSRGKNKGRVMVWLEEPFVLSR